jgi:hypothetical protein
MGAVMSAGVLGIAGGFVALFLSFWCFGIVLGVAQFVMFIVALVQILSRSMPNDAKLLWGAVAWFLPVLGPILWWTIGSKQNPG